MSRSDGTYPGYVKLTYSKTNPPEDWDEGARRCIQCKKNWPNLSEFSPSPCCNHQAGIVADATPDTNWPDAYSDLLRFRFDRFYEKWNDGATDIELCWNNTEPVSDDEVCEGIKEINSLIASLETQQACIDTTT